MKIDNKKAFLLTTLVLLIVGLSAISAADSSADTSDVSSTSSDVATTTSVDTSNSVSDSSSSTSDSSTSQTTSSSSSDVSTSSSTTHTTDSSASSSSDVSTSSSAKHTTDSTSSSSSVAKTDSSSTNSNVDTSNVKTLKTEQNSNINTTAINETPSNRTPLLADINNNTFDSYFNDDGTINVTEGSTLTFTGNVTRDQSYIIDVPVNIEGNNCTINLNGNSISFVEGAANSNITGLNFYNTQVFVNTTENIVFDNIDVSVTTTLGENVGAFAIRDGSGNITVQNSNFYAKDNGGRSLLALTLVENCTINNNTITGEGYVGNLVYINVYNGDPANTKSVTTNKNNTISNNYIQGPSSNVAVCYAVGLSGYGNKVINNTIDYVGYAITTSWVGNITDESEDPGDEHTLESYQNQYINNTVLNKGRVTGAVNTTFIGNDFSGSVTVSDDSIVTNNTMTNVTVNGSYNEITYNTVNKINLTSTSSYNTVKYNYVADEIYDNGKNNILEDNIYTLSSTSKDLKTDDDEQLVIYVTEENKDTYFRNDGSNYYTLVTRNFAQANTTYYLDFDLDNSELFISPTSNTIAGVVFSGVEGRTYTNLTIDVNAARNNTIANFNIVDGQIILRSPGSGNTLCVENNTLTGTLDSDLERLDNAVVYIGYNNQGENNTNPIIFRNNVINYNARAYSINWDVTTVPYDIVMYVDTHDTSLVYNNTISITEFDSDDTTAPTLYGVYYSSGGSGNVSCFDNNTLILEGQEYMYGLVLGNGVNGLNITGNNITVTATNYTNGIKLQSNDKNILISDNIVNCTSGLDYDEMGNQYVVYAIYVENWNYMGGDYNYYGTNINDTIIGNTIIGTGNQVYGIEGFGYDESNITGNTIIVTGTQPQGIGVIGAKLNITENTITVNGVSPDKGITVDYIPAVTAGIQIPYAVESETNISQNTITVTGGRGILIDAGADYVNIDDNRIIVSDYNYAIELNTTGTNSNVTNNYLKTDRIAGDNAVYQLVEGNDIDDNQPNGIETFIKLDPITDAKVSDVITITGTVTNVEELPFTDSKVMITVNDEEPITVDVAEDGTFQAQYTVKNVGENTVTAEYVADDTYSYSQDSITFEVPRIITNIEISDVSAYPETEYTIKGTLTNEASLQLEDQKLTIIVNSETIEVDVAEDGTFSTTQRASSKPGDYDIVLFYGGNDDYESTYTTATLTVEKYNSVITVNDATGKYNDKVVLTATVTDTELNNINEGRVVFKLNGVTIKDEEGNSLYAYVNNGVASIEYAINNNIGTYTISATYSGSDDYTDARTETDGILTVTNATADMTIVQLPSTIKSGDTIILTASVIDEENVVNDGVVIFKLNGVTLKNAEGANLNSSVVNGVASVEYTIPVDYSAKDYTLTAVFSDKNYDREEDTTTLTLTRSNVTAVLNPVYITQGEDATVQVTLYDQNGNQLERSTKVAVKVNGKTFENTATENGVLNVTLDTKDFKNPYYNLTVVFGENSAYNELRLNSIIIVDSNKNVGENSLKTASETNTYTVSNYNEFKSAINTIKASDVEDNVIILNAATTYEIDETIVWGDESQVATTLTIIGNNAILDGQGKYKFLNISEGYTVILENLTVTNCYYNGTLLTMEPTYGGAIGNFGTLIIEDSVFTKNNLLATQGGGAIANAGTLIITNTNFTDNLSDNGEEGSGAALYNNEGNITATNCRFEGNQAQCTPVLYNDYNYLIGDEIRSTVTLIDCYIGENTITTPWEFMYGYIYNAYTTLNLVNTEIDDSLIADYGGVVNRYTIEDTAIYLVYDYNGFKTTIDIIKASNVENGVMILIPSDEDYLIDETIVWGDESQAATTLRIVGNGVTLDGQGKYKFLNITEGYTVILQNVTVTNCFYNGTLQTMEPTYGGAIGNFGTLIVENSVFSKNNLLATQGGGAIANGGTLIITNTNFTDNLSDNGEEGSGAALYNNEGNITAINCRFKGNQAQCAPVLYDDYNYLIGDEIRSTVNLIDCYIGENIITTEWDFMYGYIYNAYTRLNLVNTEIDNSLIAEYGGEINRYTMENTAIYIVSDYDGLKTTIDTIKASNIENNIIVLNPSESTYYIDETIVWADESQVANNLTIIGNGVTLDGQGKYKFLNITEGYTLTLQNVTVTNCFYNGTLQTMEPTYGGAIGNFGTLIIEDSVFSKNNLLATQGGGAIANGGTLIITNTNFTDNLSDNGEEGSGAALYNNEGNITATNCRFEGNQAQCAPVLYNDYNYLLGDEIRSTVTLIDCYIGENTITTPWEFMYGYIYNAYTTLNLINTEIDDSLIAEYGGVVNRYNTIDTTITVQDVTDKYGKTTQLVATMTDSLGNPVHNGNVVFKLNGVTIKDDEGNPIKVNVENGIAVLNYTIINNPGTYTITATYSGTDTYISSRTTEEKTLTVESNQATIDVSTTTEEIKAGQTVTFTATVTDTDGAVENGVVIFKLNGVTLKDEEGNNLEATVTNGVATLEYTIPDNYSAKDYTLTAVYSGKNYDRAEANTTMTIEKSDVTATLDPITITQGSNTTISTTLYNEYGNQIERSTKVAVKVNGKTFVNTETENGVLDVTIDTSDFKYPEYDLTVIFGENSAYNQLILNSVIIVE